MTAYYNENDPYAAQWLRNLIDAGHIAPGVVDERSITDVEPADLAGFHQCHFFAGVGVWSYALRCAGIPDDLPLWTGSCPCQPFSTAGQRKGFDDERHLWPVWQRLVEVCRPDLIFGEQVSGADGRTWWDAVAGDLEGMGYAAGALDSSTAGVGGYHIRPRLYWVAHTDGSRRNWEPVLQEGRAQVSETAGGSHACSVSNPMRKGREGVREKRLRCAKPERGPITASSGLWCDPSWIRCSDGKVRPIEPGTFPLADGVAGRVGQLRAYGNSLCAPQAEAFVRAVFDIV